MEIRRLEIFLRLSQNLHFSKTAEEFGMVQSALSHQILLLEKELGCRLFERSNRWNVTLTQAGEELVIQAKHILETVQKSIEKVKASARGENGILNIALNSSSLNAEALLETFQRMSKRHPGITLKIQEEPSRKVYELVEANQTDLGLLRLSPVSSEDFEMKLLTEDPLVMVMPEKHPLARKKKLCLRDFRNERFMMPGRDDAPLQRSVFDKLCDDAGFSPKVVQELESMTTILRLLDSCNVVSMVPLAYQKQFEHLVFRKLEHCSPVLPESLIWRKDNQSALLKTFLKELFNTISV